MSPRVLAQVVVDSAGRQSGDRLFSYIIPDHLAGFVGVGSRVLVPFGHMPSLPACIVKVGTDEQSPQHSHTVKLKEILDIVDCPQLFNTEYFDFLQLVSRYYMASLPSVVSAALPPQVTPRFERIVELQPQEELTQLLSAIGTTETVLTGDAGNRILRVLADSPSNRTTLARLVRLSGLSTEDARRTLSVLRASGRVKIVSQTGSRPSARLVRDVRLTGKPAVTPKQKMIASLLESVEGDLPFSAVLKRSGTTYATMRRMHEQGIITIVSRRQMRDPLEHYGRSEVSSANSLTQNNTLTTVHATRNNPQCSVPVLTPRQQSAYDTLKIALEKTVVLSCLAGANSEPVEPWLLHGVTGSGKTEIYLRLIARSLELGRSALLLVPEISLTSQMTGRLQERFKSVVSVWHSGLSAGERYDVWHGIKEGRIRVLLGARSAVFADIPKLSLIILDEEHDASYKQSNPSPRYNARHVAVLKAASCKALVVLGSATPDIVSFFTALKTSKLLTLPERVTRKPLPEVEIIDMRVELSQGHNSDFSRRLLHEIAACLERREQIIVLMNRRGFAQHVFCKACGFVSRCRSCSVSLVLHEQRNNQYLACHHCGFHVSFVSLCPSCKQFKLQMYGLGTQRVEQELQQLFPSAGILRLDSDVLAKKGAYHSILRNFEAGQADILVGTQVVAKGLDIPAVTLVGVLSADAAFNLPDYRSSERGFQLLTQVAGRAGRGERPGKVLLQTYSTELPALKMAQQHDYASFVESELANRRQLEYPPYSQIIRVVVSGQELGDVQAYSEHLSEELSKSIDEDMHMKILGPAPCILERVKDRYRYQLLIKNMSGEPGRTLLASLLHGQTLQSGLKMAIDVDAVDLV